jgi:diguanylate cyclase (GGDEF)-like protein/PAS domain S-box-containing protein
MEQDTSAGGADGSKPVQEDTAQSWLVRRSWQAFHRTHLHDYGVGATRLWIAVALTGWLALAVSAAKLAQLPASDLLQILGWVTITAIAAAFPIQIPRTKYSIAPCDVIIFLLLAMHGTAAAAFAASVECLIGAMRTSPRLSSRIASLSAAPAAMAIGGTLFEVTQPWLQQQGLPAAASHMAALAAAALVYLAISTMALMQIVYLKRGKRLSIAEWFGSTSWVGTLYLVSAVLAGLLSLNAQQFGRSAAVVGVLTIGASLALLRVHFRRQNAEYELHEARAVAAEAEAEQNQKRFLAAFTHASIGMAIVSPEGVVQQANQALCALLGYDESQVLQREFSSLLHPGDAGLLERHVASVVARRADSFSIELRCRGADQRETWVSLHCALFDDHATADAGLIFQLHDISSRRRAEGELLHIAYHDSLTDLANRNCFQERLNVAVEHSRSDRRFSFAVMYLDLDRFKVVNDSLGHPAGDELLKEVARRLNACVRPRDLVARLGGDEFAILLEETHRQDDVLALGERLLHALEEPADINGTEVRPLASIGVTFSDLGYREPNEMLRDADIAMYQAKADGKGRLVVFDASLHEKLAHKLQLEADLRRAIDDGRLSLVFQPLFDLEPMRLHGFEALARWVHPTRGAISPGVFIALAEEAGCIESLTRWAIDEAARQLAEWRRQAPHFGALVMHVNISGKDLSRQQLVPHVRDVLHCHDLPANLLTLEITETTLMQQRELALRTLGELRELGVRLSIDDFGTGYSSLAYLSTLPFDCLKIDRSFVIGMHKSVQNVEIVRTVLSLGRSLNKTVIAEGIETHDQLLRLKELGAPMGQGYLLARPLAAHQVKETYVEGSAALH